MILEIDNDSEYEISFVMPGQSICQSDRERISSKFICTACGLLLVEPFQTSCGHLMCSSCLQTLLNTSNPVCPTDGTVLVKDEVFPDAFTRRELMQLQLHCPNNDCDWSGPYKDMQDHSNCCGHSLIQCVHDQCKKEIKRSLLAQHLEQECNYRLVSCAYCKEELPFVSLEEHIAVRCVAAPQTCKHCGKTEIPRNEMTQHETIECDEIVAECEFKAIGCNHAKVVKRKELRQHLKKGLVIHVQFLLHFVLELFGKFQALVAKVEVSTMMQTAQEELKRFTGSLADEVRNLGMKLASMLKMITGLERRVEMLESKAGGSKNDPKASADVNKLVSQLSDMTKNMERMEDKLREKTLIIERLNTKLEQVDHSMALTTVKLSDMETSNAGQPLISYNGTLLWKIDDFKRKRQDAINGVQNAIYSPPFYSSQFGYKMCARIYMNGDGFGKGTHISLFFVVMMGEYDALLPWPFQKKITMMLMDQVTGDHMTDAFRSDPDSSSFQRPKTKMNIASGSPLFMPLDSLNNRAYVRDDTMFIKIIID